MLGFMYENGKGVAPNRTKAIKWAGLAAAQGNMRALYDVASMVRENHNYPEALKWYAFGVELGDYVSEYNLADMYMEGQGVLQDYAEAEKLFRRSAAQGNPFAFEKLGIMYMKGQSVSKNYIYAHMWLNMAAAELTGDSVRDKRDNMANEMTPEDVNKAQALARECVKKKYKDC